MITNRIGLNPIVGIIYNLYVYKGQYNKRIRNRP